MLPLYTYALGGTAKIKEFIDWIDSQKSVAKTINDKYERRAKYAI